MNRVTLIGNLTRDPELKRVGEKERPVCELRLAVSNRNGRKPTYVDISTFDRSAEACAEHLGKGWRVAVDGSLALNEWEAEDGSKRSRHFVIGRVEFLNPPRDAGSQDEPDAGGESSDDEIPF